MTPLAVEVADGTAVAHHQSLEAPVLAKYLLQQPVGATAGVALEALIGTHHLFHTGLLHQVAERWEIGLPKVTGREVFYIKVVAGLLRTAVHGEVLGTGQQLVVFLTRPLQSAHHGTAHATIHVGVFAIRLLSPTPSRVAEDVDGGRPERQALILANGLTLTAQLCVLGAGLVAHGIINHLQQGVIEGTGHANARGEHGAQPVTTHAVERLAPPVELRQPEPLDGWRAVHHQLGLLLQRQAGEKVFYTLLNRQVRVLIR